MLIRHAVRQARASRGGEGMRADGPDAEQGPGGSGLHEVFDLLGLPHHVLAHAFSLLPGNDVIRLACVSRAVAAVASTLAELDVSAQLLVSQQGRSCTNSDDRGFGSFLAAGGGSRLRRLQLQVLWGQHAEGCKVGGPQCQRSITQALEFMPLDSSGSYPVATSAKCYGYLPDIVTEDSSIMDKAYPPHAPPRATALQDIVVTYRLARIDDSGVVLFLLHNMSAPLIVQLVSLSPGLQRLSISTAAPAPATEALHPFLALAMDLWLKSDHMARALEGRASPLQLLRLETPLGVSSSSRILFSDRVRRLELSCPAVTLRGPTPSSSGGDALPGGPESIRICAGEVLFMWEAEAVRSFLERADVSFGGYNGKAPRVAVEAPQLFGLHNGGAHRLRLVADYQRTMQMLQDRVEAHNT